MTEPDHEVTREEVPKVSQGEPQEVRVEVTSKYDAGEHGFQTTQVACEFRRTDSGGFSWANATPIRYTPHSDDTDTTSAFHMFHILGVEKAAEYIEEHYGPVTSSYPTLTDPE